MSKSNLVTLKTYDEINCVLELFDHQLPLVMPQFSIEDQTDISKLNSVTSPPWYLDFIVLM